MNSLNFKKWNLILGWTVFATAFIVYSLTVEPTVSFWDCGEYISTSSKLEVGHPPGAPLFQIVGAFFAMFAPSASKVALAVNMVSVTAGAFTTLFMFWSVTLLLRSFIPDAVKSKSNAVMVLGSSFIACLAFTFSDSFWFNATETEVYSMASLFIALLFWTGLRWGEDMQKPGGNKWVLLISLLTGLSFGVHFLALLAIPSIGLIYYFKNYKTVTLKNFIIANIAIIALLLFVFKLLMPYTLALFAKTEIFMVNSLGLPFNSGIVFVTLALASFFFFSLRYTRRKGLILYNTITLCLLFLFAGFSVWVMLPIRSNANVVINESRPDDAADVLAYYNMEQYPEQKLVYGPLYTSAYAGLDKNNPYTDSKPNYERDNKTGRYVIVNNYRHAYENTDGAHKSFLPRMASERHAANYMAISGPPKFSINYNYPFESELAGYGIDINQISPEQAADAASQLKNELQNIIVEFKTAYSAGKLDENSYDSFLKNYGKYLTIEKPSFTDNMAFMFSYQFGYMYWRYFMWNFAGRQSDVQGKYNNEGNWLSGIDFIDEMRLGPQDSLTDDMLGNKGRNLYYFLPLLLGLIGILYHAKKDLKSFYILLAFFLFTSLAVKVFLNEKPFEVRERDYVLVGSFYVFAIWIAFGVYAIYDVLKKYTGKKYTGPVVLAASLLAAPFLMANQNWDDHNRSGRYTALAMAKAYLDSCEPNAILFTVGDNDTFPLWYAQEVEGYRTDVRVVCGTYLSADWYIDQMKQQAYDSMPLPISFLHDQYIDGTRDYIIHNPKTEARMDIKDFIAFTQLDDERATVEFENGQHVNYYPTNKIRIPVNRRQVLSQKVVGKDKRDSIVPYIDIDLPNAVGKHRLIQLDIIANNNWQRPIYFTGGSFEDEEYIWMKDYLQLTGMTYKLVPVKTPYNEDSFLDLGYVDSEKMYDTVKKWDWGNSGSRDIYVDPETKRNSFNYRKNLARLTDTLISEGKTEKAREIINLAMENMPVESYGLYFLYEPFAEGYYKTGDKNNARQLLEKLAGKYRQKLSYYKSLGDTRQNQAYNDIIGDIERYRNLLIIMKQNHDSELYEKHRIDFNRYNAMFKRFKREDA
jgi:hypothetical protein